MFALHLVPLANTHCHLVQENSTTYLLIKHFAPFTRSENPLINAFAISIRLQTERSNKVRYTEDKHIRAAVFILYTVLETYVRGFIVG